MNPFMQALYNASLSDIEDMILCIEELKKLNNNLLYTKRDGFYSKSIDLCKKELKSLLKYHEDKFNEKINIRIITDKLNGVAMRITDALIMISYIEKTGVRLSYLEQSFIDSLKQGNSIKLTQKQADWLRKIYERTTS